MKGWAEKLAQGWLPASPPPGYMTVTESGKKIHVPNLETVPLMQRTFRLYATPDQSIQSICDEMAAMGLVTSKGRPFSKSQVAKILRNPFYIGINRFNGKDYPGAQEPIISKALFRAVQKKLDGNRASRVRKHNPVFKCLIHCATCGSLITWQLQKGRYYGACQRRFEVCKGRRLLREDRVERIVIAQLEAMDDPAGKVLRKVKSALKTIEQQYVGYYREKTIESLYKQRERIRRMDDMLYEDKLAGQITSEFYDAKHQQFIGQTAEINERLIRLHEAQDVKQPIASPEIESDSPLVRLYIFSTPRQKRLIMSNIFKRLTADGGSITLVAIE